MIYREATIDDIAQIQVVRNQVKENTLSHPSLVSDEDCVEFLTRRGKGWVCETGNTIVGFSIADLKEHNIWALFIHPDHEGNGIGKELHRLMMDWYFSQTDHTVWLGTAPNTRAEKFYTQQGWRNVGVVNKGEVKFEMTKEEWSERNADNMI
jgi:GNAT superfamily N-acetyltransferase